MSIRQTGRSDIAQAPSRLVACSTAMEGNSLSIAYTRHSGKLSVEEIVRRILRAELSPTPLLTVLRTLALDMVATPPWTKTLVLPSPISLGLPPPRTASLKDLYTKLGRADIVPMGYSQICHSSADRRIRGFVLSPKRCEIPALPRIEDASRALRPNELAQTVSFPSVAAGHRLPWFHMGLGLSRTLPFERPSS